MINPTKVKKSLVVKIKIYREITLYAFIVYNLYGHAPAKYPLPRGKFTILVDSSLVITAIHLVCMDNGLM